MKTILTKEMMEKYDKWMGLLIVQLSEFFALFYWHTTFLTQNKFQKFVLFNSLEHSNTQHNTKENICIMLTNNLHKIACLEHVCIKLQNKLILYSAVMRKYLKS